MASKALRRQALAVSLFDGFIEMFWEQNYKGNSGSDEFVALYSLTKVACSNAYSILILDTGGTDNAGTNRKIMRKSAAVIEILKEKGLGDKFSDMDAVSFIIGILMDVMSNIKPGSKKYQAFESLWGLANEFVKYLDPDQEYDETIGFDAAKFFDTIEV